MLVLQLRHLTNLGTQEPLLPASAAVDVEVGAAPSSSSSDEVKLFESAAALLTDPLGGGPLSWSQSGECDIVVVEIGNVIL